MAACETEKSYDFIRVARRENHTFDCRELKKLLPESIIDNILEDPESLINLGPALDYIVLIKTIPLFRNELLQRFIYLKQIDNKHAKYFNDILNLRYDIHDSWPQNIKNLQQKVIFIEQAYVATLEQTNKNDLITELKRINTEKPYKDYYVY